jgi:predicted RNase H-like HicB family nuclease
MNAAIRLKENLLAGWKWALSFRTRDWQLADYPVIFRRQRFDAESAYDNNARFKSHQWRVLVVNWATMDGTGDTRQEALADLQSTFLARKARLAEEGKPLPRPGTRVSVQFASRERVNDYPDLAQDFIHRVLGLEWAFISDESCLWHFHADENNDALFAKIREVYGVDVSDIESGNLGDILERIAESRQTIPAKP